MRSLFSSQSAAPHNNCTCNPTTKFLSFAVVCSSRRFKNRNLALNFWPVAWSRVRNPCGEGCLFIDVYYFICLYFLMGSPIFTVKWDWITMIKLETPYPISKYDWITSHGNVFTPKQRKQYPMRNERFSRDFLFWLRIGIFVCYYDFRVT